MLLLLLFGILTGNAQTIPNYTGVWLNKNINKGNFVVKMEIKQENRKAQIRMIYSEYENGSQSMRFKITGSGTINNDGVLRCTVARNSRIQPLANINMVFLKNNTTDIKWVIPNNGSFLPGVIFMELQGQESFDFE